MSVNAAHRFVHCISEAKAEKQNTVEHKSLTELNMQSGCGVGVTHCEVEVLVALSYTHGAVPVVSVPTQRHSLPSLAVIQERRPGLAIALLLTRIYRLAQTCLPPA